MIVQLKLELHKASLESSDRDFFFFFDVCVTAFRLWFLLVAQNF